MKPGAPCKIYAEVIESYVYKLAGMWRIKFCGTKYGTRHFRLSAKISVMNSI